MNFASANNSNFGDPSFEYWYPKNRVHFEIVPNGKPLTADEWLIFNRQAIGYYRIQYDDQNYKLITSELVDGDYTKIDLRCRSQIIDDAFELANSGFISYEIVLNLAQYLRRESSYVPWATALRKLSHVGRLLADGRYHRHFEVRTKKSCIAFTFIYIYIISTYLFL